MTYEPTQQYNEITGDLATRTETNTPQRPDGRGAVIVLAVALVAVAFFAVVGLLLSALLAGTATEQVESTDTTTTAEAPEATTTPTTTSTSDDPEATAATTTVDTSTQPTETTAGEGSTNSTNVDLDPSTLLTDFATAWDNADWETMNSLATSNAVAVAMEWYDEGGNATTGMAYAIENGCFEQFDSGKTCQIVYAPAEGFGLIFNVTYDQTDTGLKITDLVFAGDAG